MAIHAVIILGDKLFASLSLFCFFFLFFSVSDSKSDAIGLCLALICVSDYFCDFNFHCNK
jgi:hypothetical protein